jgi:hypothetical protein
MNLTKITENDAFAEDFTPTLHVNKSQLPTIVDSPPNYVENYT